MFAIRNLERSRASVSIIQFYSELSSTTDLTDESPCLGEFVCEYGARNDNKDVIDDCCVGVARSGLRRAVKLNIGPCYPGTFPLLDRGDQTSYSAPLWYDLNANWFHDGSGPLRRCSITNM